MRKPYLCMFMASLLLTVSCEQYENDQQLDSSESITSKFSGEDIFKGLFYFQNDIPNHISHLKGMKSEIDKLKRDKSEVVDTLEELSEISVTYINKKYPNFFDEFQSAMYSGNLHKIESSLNTSVKMIEQATLTSKKYVEAFDIGEKIQNDPELKRKISDLDLNKEKDVKEFSMLVHKISNKDEIGQEDAVAIAAVAAVAYIVAGVVSFVVAAYSVVTKVAYWDPTGVQAVIPVLDAEVVSIDKDTLVLEMDELFTIDEYSYD